MRPEVRAEFERRILCGESVGVVAADTGYSTSAASRHVRNHLNAQQMIVMRSLDASTLHVHDLAERMLALADEASRVRTVSTDPRTHLLSIREEQNVLSTLVNRLGIDSTETIENLADARALAISLSRVLADEPTVAAALSRDLSEQGADGLAQAFLRLASEASARHVAHAAGTTLREVTA